jgi:hypothetical protein
MRCTRFCDGDDPKKVRPVFGEYHRPKVYPRKSNFSSGSLQTRVLVSFTVNLSFDIMLRIVAKASSA